MSEEQLQDEETCAHARIVPLDADWAKCLDCGDSTFPLSDRAAGWDPEGPESRRQDPLMEALVAQRDGLEDKVAARDLWLGKEPT